MQDIYNAKFGTTCYKPEVKNKNAKSNIQVHSTRPGVTDVTQLSTKDHTPSTLALGTTNSISELSQMIGIALGAPFIRYVSVLAERDLSHVDSVQLSLRVLVE